MLDRVTKAGVQMNYFIGRINYRVMILQISSIHPFIWVTVFHEIAVIVHCRHVGILKKEVASGSLSQQVR